MELEGAPLYSLLAILVMTLSWKKKVELASKEATGLDS